MPNSTYALILAGGSGERFWPVSRRSRPKQLLRLVSKTALLEDTVSRLEGWIPRDRILVLTNVEQENSVRELLKGFPEENIVAEPAKRDTAAAIALGVGWVAMRDHFATMMVLPADHVISNRDAFRETMEVAAEAAQDTASLATIGIKPTWPCPGFGYIEQGTPVKLPNGSTTPAVHRVVRFREKPNIDLAESFLRKGNFRWNAGMFVWSVPTILREFNRHAPELADFISQLHGPKDFERVLKANFNKLPRISFDYAVMEKADRVLVNSLHSQGVETLGHDLEVEARAPDGLVEAFRVRSAPGFALAVQWHPEWQVMSNPFSRTLFAAFGDAARARVNARQKSFVS